MFLLTGQSRAVDAGVTTKRFRVGGRGLVAHPSAERESRENMPT